MNPELLAKAHPHLREEHGKQRDLIGVLERALSLSIAAYRAGRAPEELPGRAPAADADAVEWVDYYVGEGAKVFYEELQLQMGGDGGTQAAA